MNCEKLVDHEHPMLKFKTEDHFEKFKKDLFNKYPDILDLQNVEPPKPEEVKVKIEEVKIPEVPVIIQPKIVDNISKSVHTSCC